MRVDKEKGESLSIVFYRFHSFIRIEFYKIQFFVSTGYIDLSKRRVSAEDVIKCEEKYNKSKTVHTIMRHVSEKTGADMEHINDLVTWPLYKKYGHAYDAFKLSIT